MRNTPTSWRAAALAAFVTLAFLTVTVLPAGPAAGFTEPTDGVTAEIIPLGTVSNVPVLQADADGNYAFQVKIFQQDDLGVWDQVRMRATLRAWAFNASSGQEEETGVSVPFTTDTVAATKVSFPASALDAPTEVDIWVTFSELGVDPKLGKVPTSHYHAAQNHAISLGQFDLADELDFHSTRSLALPAT